MPFAFSTGSIRFSGGTCVALESDGLVVIVGPNNCGKTSILREMLEAATEDVFGPVTSQITFLRSGDADELKAWLDCHVALVKDRHGTSKEVYSWLTSQCDVSGQWGFRALWKNSELEYLAPFLCDYCKLDDRLVDLQPINLGLHRHIEPFNILYDAPQNPIHVLLKDESVEAQVSDLFRKAFGVDLILNRGAGTDYFLHCGDRPIPATGEDRVSASYVARVSALPELSKQGHGMRSYAACLLMLHTSPSPIQLIDEPEAFLHPPQANLLGNTLANHKPKGRQLFVATHSGDFVRGVLDSRASAISVVRVTRKGNVNVAIKLDLNEIRKLWSDPILRFSNVLDGLFHETVVLCESDGDCRFYAAILDAIESGRESRTDALFTTTSGKYRMPVVASALVGLGVTTRVITDFDIFRDTSPLRELFEALGGQWNEIDNLYLSLKKSIEQKLPPVTREQVRNRINEILQRDANPNLSESEVDQIRGAVRTTSVWDFAKQAGIGIVPSGQATQDLDRLLKCLNSVGLFVVPCGELERFAPSVPNHGPRWVAEVLKRDLSMDVELESGRRFVSEVLQLTGAVTELPEVPETKNVGKVPERREGIFRKLRRIFSIC